MAKRVRGMAAKRAAMEMTQLYLEYWDLNPAGARAQLIRERKIVHLERKAAKHVSRSLEALNPPKRRTR